MAPSSDKDSGETFNATGVTGSSSSSGTTGEASYLMASAFEAYTPSCYVRIKLSLIISRSRSTMRSRFKKRRNAPGLTM